MTIWILALVLLGCLAGVGFAQGAIRVAFSLIGIPTAALLSPALAKFVKPVLSALGLMELIWLWVIAPIVVFIVILSVFKSAGFAVNRKVDVFYRNKAGDLRRALWERLNARLGLCLGLVNALMYLVVIAWVIYAMGYWTVQIAPSDADPRTLRILNRLSWDLQKTGMHRVAAAVDRLPDNYYGMADMAGLLYQNPLLEARLSRYPAFLSLGEKPEFQAIGNDEGFTSLRLRRAPIREVLNNPAVDQIVRNPETVKLVWNMVTTDRQDLREFLETGKSLKYTDPLLGRWTFNGSASIAIYRREKPNIPASEVQKMRRWMDERFARTLMVAGPDRKILIKEFPQIRPQPGQPEYQTLSGNWTGGDGDYVFTFDGNERTAHIEGTKLSLKGESLPLVFEKEYDCKAG